VPNVDFKFFVGYGKVKVPIKVILKNYTNFVVTDGTGSEWPLDKMEIKKWKQISTSTFAVQVLLDSGNNAQRSEKTTPKYFLYRNPEGLSLIARSIAGLLHIVSMQRGVWRLPAQYGLYAS
jgi:hypothetical protein